MVDTNRIYVIEVRERWGRTTAGDWENLCEDPRLKFTLEEVQAFQNDLTWEDCAYLGGVRTEWRSRNTRSHATRTLEYVPKAVDIEVGEQA